MKRTRKNHVPRSSSLPSRDLTRVGGGFGGEDLGTNDVKPVRKRPGLSGSLPGDTEL